MHHSSCLLHTHWTGKLTKRVFAFASFPCFSSLPSPFLFLYHSISKSTVHPACQISTVTQCFSAPRKSNRRTRNSDQIGLALVDLNQRDCRSMSYKKGGILNLNWANENGEFVQKVSQFRNKISANGPHPPESGRYHLYISLACPWAHRTLIARQLKGLEDVITLSVVHYLMGENGWEFRSADEVPGCIPDSATNAKFLRQIYFQSEPNYDGRFTVPVLYDKKTRQIVNNESAEILRMFNSEFNSFAKKPKLDLYPISLRPRIDDLNEIIYNGINNGVYRAGLATAQGAYEDAAKLVHRTLMDMDKILGENEFICGGVLTETDIRLFTSVIRYDTVYYGHFKCNLSTARELPNINRWMFAILKLPGVKETVNMEHIKKHYYMYKEINPSGIVPLYNGPMEDEVQLDC